MKLLHARQLDPSLEQQTDAFVHALDEWLAELIREEGPLRRGQVIDRVLDVRGALMTIRELEGVWEASAASTTNV